MKVQILQENLNKGLIAASRSVSVKPQLPILSNVLLKTDKNRLQISATNLETGLNLWLGVKVEKEGGITVPAKVLSEVVSSLPADKIDLEVKENILNLNCAGFSASFNGIAASEFPKMPNFLSEDLFSFSVEKLLEAINQVCFAAATDEGRPVLTGVLFKIEGDNLTKVATDGYRLSLKETKLDNKAKEDWSLILPAKTLMEVGRIIAENKTDDKKTLKIGFTKDKNQIIFIFDEIELYSRVIEGEFPQYTKIIPQTFSSRVFLDTESFGRAIKVVSVFARDSSNIVKFKINEGNLEISAVSPQIGENKNFVEAKTEGEEGEIAFNFRFLQNFLSAVSTKEISLETNGPLAPGVFRAVGDNSFFHIIMPVRLQTEEK